ncbi:MAG: ABC transporter ATP-binding protein, partial [Defluviitaleaceae bacterium]|nr:ABC transporter ATP-binding protein [Defluviitaleaceae bacterium]
MLKLVKRYGKSFLPLFLIAVMLLIARATAELSLPALMSDIVDVGIGQGGIDYVVPTQLSEESWERLREILPEWVLGEMRDLRMNTEISPEAEIYIARALAQLQYGSADFSDSVVNHLAVSFIRAEYARLGVDMDAHQMGYVYRTGGWMVVLTLFAVTAAITQFFISARIATGMARKIRADIFSKVTGFNNAEYNNFSTASLITRCTNDISQVQTLLATAIRVVVFSPIMGIGGILMVLGTDASMAWVIALAVGAMVSFITMFIIIATPKFKIIQKLIDKINLVTREGLTGMMVIRAFNTQGHEAARFDGVNSKLRKTALFLARLGAAQMPVISLVMGF